MRKTFIFGNGLGMSISADAYNLTSVMSDVWGNGDLNVVQKGLISTCLPNGAERPTSEEQLATLQDTVGACEVLLGVRDTGAGHWLSEQGRQFPDAVRRFAFLVARSMFVAKHPSGEKTGQRCALSSEFSQPLVDHIKANQTHVATLNYDGLLSSALSDAGLFSGSNPDMLDGFLESKFDRTNLFRKNKHGAWYRHLHGCPLFVDRGKSTIRKISPGSLAGKPGSPKRVGKHIVLTHLKHKPKIIETSDILSIYWEFLEMAIDESEEVLMFGYSGNDAHLNRLISQVRGEKNIRVIEWLGAGNRTRRQAFWKEQLGGDVDLTLLEDVLTFGDW